MSFLFMKSSVIYITMTIFLDIIILKVSALCLNTCTEQFRKSLIQIIGETGSTETELLAPFHSIIAKSRTGQSANKKIEWICFVVSKFDSCTNKCPSNNAKSLRMASFYQWNTICNISKNDPESFDEFIICERNHIEQTSKKCSFIKINEEMALKNFCNQLIDYSKCYASIPFQCSSKASDIWLQINYAIQKSFNVLLQLSSQHLHLPDECQQSMSTTLPAGIITTIHPPLITKTISTINIITSSLSTPTRTSTLNSIEEQTPLYLDDSSTMDDYGYFQQTDDYKFFGSDKNSIITTNSPVMTSTFLTKDEKKLEIDYWTDLDNPKTNKNQKHNDEMIDEADEVLNKNNYNYDNDDDETDIIFVTPTKRYETAATKEKIYIENPFNSGTSFNHFYSTYCIFMYHSLLKILLYF